MKSDKVAVNKRVEEVLEFRLLSAPFRAIRQHAADAGWNVSERQLWRYIEKSDKILAEERERDREKNFNKAIAQRDALFGRAVSVSDYRTAHGILQDRDQLLGLYPTKSLEFIG